MAYNSRQYATDHPACQFSFHPDLPLRFGHPSDPMLSVIRHHFVRDHCRCRNSSGSCLSVCPGTSRSVSQATSCWAQDTLPLSTFRLADYTADRDSHPALKICRRKFITFFEQLPHQPVAISHNLQYLCNPQPEGLPPSTSTCRSSRRDVSASSESNSPDATSPDGGIGRRAGLKHQWSNPCRFDPGSGYPTKCKCLTSRYLHFSFSFLHHGCTTEWAV